MLDTGLKMEVGEYRKKEWKICTRNLMF